MVCRDQPGRLLLTRFREPGHPDDGKWTMPGGGMEWGESAVETASRELAEETGFTATLGSVIGVFSRWYTTEESARGDAGHQIGIVYEASHVRGELRTEFDEDDTTDDARWFDIDRARASPHVELVDFVLSLDERLGHSQPTPSLSRSNFDWNPGSPG